MEMLGMLLTSWPRMLVFLWLMVRPNSLQASAKVIISRCKAFSLCAVKAASSANSISLISTFRTLVSAQRRARLKRFPSFLVDSSTEKKMSKNLSASTRPCFTPLLIGKESEVEPSYWTVSCMSSWKDIIFLRSLGGHPILCKRVNNPFLLIRLEGLTLVDKGNIQGFPLLCSRHFSCSCLRKKIMSIVDLPALNPHWASGYTLFTSFCKLFNATRAKAFPVILRRDIPRCVLQSLRCPLSFGLVERGDVRVTHVLGHCSFLPALKQELV